MANDLMIPESGIPAHILALGAAAVAADNEAALAGLSGGVPPRLKQSGTKFVLVGADGNELPYPASKLVIINEVQYVPVIVLKTKAEMPKSFYLKPYNSDEEGVAPDCWSDDGKRPSPGVIAPIADSCALCPKNAFGSGARQDGTPGKGKACRDFKIVATFIPGFGIYMLRITPASFNNWQGYVKGLSSHNIPISGVVSLVGFDPTSSSPVLIFNMHSYISEANIAKMREKAASPEVLEIIGGTAPAPAQKALPASQEVIDQPPAEDEAKKKAAEAAAKKKADAAAKKKKADEAAAAAAKTPPPGDDLDLDMSFDSGDTAPPVDAGGTSDDELAAALGL